MTLPTAIVANLLIVIVFAFGWLVFGLDGDLYYRSVQEDEYLEWASVWAFVAAAALYLRHALGAPFDPKHAWFVIGLALFCLFVALEEISWGQRLFGYRPPAYFLEFNYQQELTVHNIIDTDLRKLAFQFVAFGYGVILPLTMLVPVVGRHLERFGLVAPPAALIPAFLATGIVQVIYPLKYTGEWAEMMLGLCFLFSAMSIGTTMVPSDARARPHPAGRLAIAWIIVFAAGVATSAATRLQSGSNEAYVQFARFELEALKRDFMASDNMSLCGRHKRLYTIATQYGMSELFDGEFARLTRRELPEQRAAFLLDPWNHAYWIRDTCETRNRERTIFIYSFGPNRRRDSTKSTVGGDDLAVVIRGHLPP